MFNLINKKNSWILIGTLVLGVMLLALPQKTFAIWGSQRYRLNVGTNTVANKLSARTNAIASYDTSKYDPAENKFTTDIFWDNASKYKIKKQSKSLFWLEAVKGTIRSTFPSCNISEKQLLWILFYTNWTWVYLKEEIIKTVPSWQWPTIWDKEKWCEALSQCMLWNDKFINATCDSFVRDAYFGGAALKERLLTMEESNLWNEKYYNGTLEDSTYDIFYDMWQLAKIFYEDVKPVSDSSAIFYRMPQFSNWWGSAWSSNWGSSNPSSSQQSTNRWGTSQTPWTTIGNKSQGTSTTSNPGTTRWGTQTNNPWTSRWWNSIPSITDDPEINSLINNWTQEQETLTNNWNVAYINKCVVSWSPKLEEAYLAAEEDEELGDEDIPSPFEVSEEFIDELTEDIIKNSNEIKIRPNNPLTWENQKEQWDVPWALWASTGVEIIDDLRKQLQGCADKCDALRFDEKAACKIKCLCAEYSSKALPENTELKFLEEWALRIRICNIPSKNIVVSTSTKMVTSIETIIVEIHNTLKALFESWELTPKMKKQEWLDTSMNNIKFSDIVSFNIWMMFKRPTEEKEVKKEDLKEQKNNLENETLGTTQNSNNVVASVGPQNHAATTMSETTKAPENSQVTESTDVLIVKNRISWVNAEFEEFKEEHLNLINNLTNVINEMTKTIEWRMKK